MIRAGRYTTFVPSCALLIGLSLTAVSGTAQARRGGDSGDRSEFYGIVEARPKSALVGTWVIGGRSYLADAGTHFDQTEGDLEAGACAKVHIRDGRVHEIDSEPMRNCRE